MKKLFFILLFLLNTPSVFSATVLYSNNFDTPEPPQNYTLVINTGAGNPQFVTRTGNCAELNVTRFGATSIAGFSYPALVGTNAPVSLEFDYVSNTITGSTLTSFMDCFLAMNGNASAYMRWRLKLAGSAQLASVLSVGGGTWSTHPVQNSFVLANNDHIKIEYTGDTCNVFVNGVLKQEDVRASGNSICGTFGMGIECGGSSGNANAVLISNFVVKNITDLNTPTPIISPTFTATPTMTPTPTSTPEPPVWSSGYPALTPGVDAATLSLQTVGDSIAYYLGVPVGSPTPTSQQVKNPDKINFYPNTAINVGITVPTDACYNLSSGGGYIWGAAGTTLFKINPATMQIVGSLVIDMTGGLGESAYGYGSVWITDGGIEEGSPNTVVRVNPTTMTLEATIPSGGLGPLGIICAYDWVLVSNNLSDTYSIIDPNANTVAATYVVGNGLYNFVDDDTNIWMHDMGSLYEISSQTGRVVKTVPWPQPSDTHILGPSFMGLAYGDNTLWVTDSSYGRVYRYNPITDVVSNTIEADGALSLISYDVVSNCAYVSNWNYGYNMGAVTGPPGVLKIDASSNSVVAFIDGLGITNPNFAMVSNGSLWVTNWASFAPFIAVYTLGPNGSVPLTAGVVSNVSLTGLIYNILYNFFVVAGSPTLQSEPVQLAMPSYTPTYTPTFTPTPTLTVTLTSTYTYTPTYTATPTLTVTATPTMTITTTPVPNYIDPKVFKVDDDVRVFILE